MQQVAQPWVMLMISHSSFLVGVDSFALNAPGWLFTLWGGILADRRDRKRIILFFQGIQFLAILALVVLFASGALRPWMIIFISFCVGATDAISMPSFQSIVPSLVPTEEIPQAVSLNSIQFNLSRTLGPAIAGLVMAQFGAMACFGANAVSFLPFFLSIFWIYPKQGFRIGGAVAPEESFRKAFREVLVADGAGGQLLSVLVTSLFASSLVTFCPVLIKDVIGGEAREFGDVSAAFGLGGLLGAVLAYFLASRFKARSPSLFGLALGIVVLLVAGNRSLSALFCLMIAGGALLTIANTSANSNLQLKAGNHVRGRYLSLYQLALRGGMSLGALLTGAATSRFGIAAALAANGALAIAIHLGLLIVRVTPRPGGGAVPPERSSPEARPSS